MPRESGSKNIIAARIKEKCGMSQKDARFALDVILGFLKKSLSEKDNIVIRNFGTFKVKHKKSRWARNPRTGEAAQISERDVVQFKPGRHFKRVINE